MIGHIHSIESFATLDGPGVRMAVFFQGCPLRCVYCHNPDTWEIVDGTPMTVQDILERYQSKRAFYENGGLTVGGGEPMLQLPFLTALFEQAKHRKIHTCLDTSGALFRETEAFEKLISVTDLVLLDIKHTDTVMHRRLTGVGNERVLAFAHHLEKRRVPMWIRHVVVPGVTDDAHSLEALGRFAAGLSCVQTVELLPYHTLGISKYEALGIPYPLQEVPPLSEKALANAQRILQRTMHPLGEK